MTRSLSPETRRRGSFLHATCFSVCDSRPAAKARVSSPLSAGGSEIDQTYDRRECEVDLGEGAAAKRAREDEVVADALRGGVRGRVLSRCCIASRVVVAKDLAADPEVERGVSSGN